MITNCFLLMQTMGLLKTMLKQNNSWFRPDSENMILYRQQFPKRCLLARKYPGLSRD